MTFVPLGTKNFKQDRHQHGIAGLRCGTIVSLKGLRHRTVYQATSEKD
jgi:hypothetical protein